MNDNDAWPTAKQMLGLVALGALVLVSLPAWGPGRPSRDK